MTTDSPGGGDPRRLIADVITGAVTGREHVASLLGLLDVGDEQVSLGAATALCVVAEAHPESVTILVRRLADRAGDDSLATELALSYLAARYPTVVSDVLDSIDDEASERLRRRRSEGRGNVLLDRSPLSNRDIGRTSLPGEGTDPGPQQVYTAEDSDQENDHAGRAGSGDESNEETDDEDGSRLGNRPLVPDADWLPIVEYESSFERLSILAPRDSRRYGEGYRTLGTRDEEEYALAIRLLNRPQENTGEFVADIESRFEEWESVSDLDNVCTLYDWHTEPGLWAATEYTAETLADQEQFDPMDAVWHATQLAGAVTTLHERGVVHGGIDPQNVAYYGNLLTEEERQPPLLDNVGLMHVYRYYFTPATYLDPRYAAPEYYDRRFGRIDHATDIYQLGAVCFRLFTGRSPYAGSFETVKDRIVDGEVPAPSDVADVPDAVDDVVGKAMARQKLARYETTSQLTQELRALGDPDTDSGD